MDDGKIASCGSDEFHDESSDGTREKDKGEHEATDASDRYEEHSGTEQGASSSGVKEDVIFMSSESPSNTSQQFQEKCVKSIDEADAALRLPDGFLEKLGKPVENACEIQELEQYHSKVINIDSSEEDSTRLENRSKIAGIRIQPPLNVTLHKDLSASVTSKIAQLKVDESVHDRLYTACAGGDLKSVEAILDEHYDILMPDERGQTPLYAACIGNQPQIIEYLVARGYTVDHQDNEGKTPLHIAFECRQLDIAYHLLFKYKANWTLRDARGWSPWHSALDQSYGFFARHFEEFLAEGDGTYISMRPLFQACDERKFDKFELLLDTNYVTHRNSDGDTALHVVCAARCGDAVEIDNCVKTAQSLVEYGSPLNLRNKEGNTPLMIACLERNQKVIELLLFNGCHTHLQNQKGYAALHIALFARCDSRIIQTLIDEWNADLLSDEGLSPLMCACMVQNHEAVAMLLNAKADLSEQDNGGNTALHLAIINKAGIEFLKELIRHCQQAHLDAIDNDGCSALMVACMYGQYDTVALLLQAGASATLCDNKGNTALHLAVLNEAGKEIMKELIRHCQQAHLDAINNQGHSALMLACMYGQDDTVALLLQAGASATLSDKYGNTALHLALIYETGIEIVKELIHHCQQAHLDATNNKGRSALMMACEPGQDDTVALLLQAGASTTLCDNDGRTCLHLALSNGCTCSSDTVRALLDHGAPVDVIANNGNTALSIACAHASVSVVQLLLEAGANPNIPIDCHDNTSLHMCGNTNVRPKVTERSAKAALLLRYGADPEMKNVVGRKPLDYTIQQGNFELVKVFCHHDPDMSLESGETALHFCCKNGIPDMVAWMLEHGVDKDRVCDAGTPLELALSHGHKNIVYMLLNAGANASLSAERTGFVDTIYRQRLRFKDILQHIITTNCNVDFTARDADHETLFFKACKDDDEEVVKMLLDSKHDIGINLCNKQGQSPVWVTCKNAGNPFDHALPILHFIVRGNREVDVDRPDDTQTTPLHLVCQENRASMVTLIVHTSAKSLNARDAKGRTPLQLASDEDVISLLEKFGARKD